MPPLQEFALKFLSAPKVRFTSPFFSLIIAVCANFAPHESLFLTPVFAAPQTQKNATTSRAVPQNSNAKSAVIAKSTTRNPISRSAISGAKAPISSTRNANSAAPIALPAGFSRTPKTSPEAQLLDPNVTRFPRTSLHDFSDLLDAPAGKHGFLERRGEHFYWENGARAKFWGINVANSSLQKSNAEIDRMIADFRAAGFNLVRLHHFDERDGIIDPKRNDSRHFLAARLRKLDYWIYKARAAGIYVYLDLLDYRRFKAGDGVANAEAIGRAARPYNVFDARLITLQKEYARMLLRDHVNEYSKLAYADDPTVVMLEIYDESGLFMKRNVWRQMPQPYAANFKTLWNNWLRAQYRSTENLKSAWSANGERVLESGESLENGSIELPFMARDFNRIPAEQRIWASSARRNDGARFADEIHRDYLRDMKKYLRGIGVRIPVSTVGRFDDITDLRSSAAETDFTSTNFYYDHPYWGAGKPAWALPSYFHNRNAIAETGAKSFAYSMAVSRIKGSPLVVREWNYCWPNSSRGSGMIEAASYAALQDVDAMILFCYEITPTPRVFYFNVRDDTSRWGLSGVAARVFLRGLVSPAKKRVTIPFNQTDLFSYNEYSNSFYDLAWNSRVENDFYDQNYRADKTTSLILPPGRSAAGTFEGAPALLHTENLTRDLTGRTSGAPEYLREYSIPVQSALESNANGNASANAQFSYNGVLFPRGTTRNSSPKFVLPLALLRLQKREIVGVDEANGVAHGFIDRAQNRLIFGSLNDDETILAARSALQLFAPANSSAQNEYSNASAKLGNGAQKALGNVKVALSDTGELLRDARLGRLLVDTPQFQAICGKNLGGVGATAFLSDLRIENAGNGAWSVLSLDGLPLKKSRRWMLKMTSDTSNFGQQTGRDPRFSAGQIGQRRLTMQGNSPITTNGAASSTRTKIWLNNRLILEIGLRGGSLELQADGAKRRFWCDTPNVVYRAPR